MSAECIHVIQIERDQSADEFKKYLIKLMRTDKAKKVDLSKIKFVPINEYANYEPCEKLFFNYKLKDRSYYDTYILKSNSILPVPLWSRLSLAFYMNIFVFYEFPKENKGGRYYFEAGKVNNLLCLDWLNYCLTFWNPALLPKNFNSDNLQHYKYELTYESGVRKIEILEKHKQFKFKILKHKLAVDELVSITLFATAIVLGIIGFVWM